MNHEKYIVLLDPALQDNDGKESSNLGDLVISEHNIQLLESLFPGKEIIRLSSHSFLTIKNRSLVKNALFSFVGGSNLLYSDMITYRQFLLRKGKLLWLFPGIKNLVLMGAGWGPDYERKLTFRTKLLYKNILHPAYFHSVRDSFTSLKLESETGRKTLNTSCVSMWSLDGINTNLNSQPSQCLFTLTDYNTDRENDEKLISLLFDHFPNLHFFPQGSEDIHYINSMDIYKKNKTKFKLLPHSYEVFKKFISNESFIYLGTRLHSGINCLANNRQALILAIDNRAAEIVKDTNLPVINRTAYDKMNRWLTGENVFSNPISIPGKTIKKWKQQFS